jgi:hypothetical protein
VLSELRYHGLGSRIGKKRADLVHQPLDPVLVAGPWIAAGALAFTGLRRLSQLVPGRRS